MPIVMVVLGSKILPHFFILKEGSILGRFLKPVIKPNKGSLQGALWEVYQAPQRGLYWRSLGSCWELFWVPE